DIKFSLVSPTLVQSGPLSPDKWANREQEIKDLENQRAAASKAAEEALGTGNTAEAEKQNNLATAPAGKIARPSVQPPKDEPQRRARLASLLVHLDLSAAWQKRTSMVIGIKAYVAALDGQTVRFKEMIDRVDRATAEDQDRFVTEYAELRALAIKRT